MHSTQPINNAYACRASVVLALAAYRVDEGEPQLMEIQQQAIADQTGVSRSTVRCLPAMSLASADVLCRKHSTLLAAPICWPHWPTNHRSRVERAAVSNRWRYPRVNNSYSCQFRPARSATSARYFSSQFLHLLLAARRRQDITVEQCCCGECARANTTGGEAKRKRRRERERAARSDWSGETDRSVASCCLCRSMLTYLWRHIQSSSDDCNGRSIRLLTAAAAAAADGGGGSNLSVRCWAGLRRCTDPPWSNSYIIISRWTDQRWSWPVAPGNDTGRDIANAACPGNVIICERA